MILTARCTGEAFSYNIEDFSDLRRVLTQLATKYPTIPPLHLTVHMRRDLRCGMILANVFYGFPAVPIACDFHYTSFDSSTDFLRLAYDLGAVVHNTEENSVEGVNMLAIELAAELGELFINEEEKQEDEDEKNIPPGQIFLCDVPRSVLSHQELAESEDPVKTARLKLFNLCYFSNLERNFTGSQSWDYFTSRVKLVERGFKPSEADIAASIKRRSVNPRPDGHANNQEIPE